jgi:phage terminase Nu1 subunit (DNA packaging protein)
MGKRPGNLKQYASHAGISRQAAAEQLRRVGIDYLQPFDFAEADKRREAARHADREAFATPIYHPNADEEPVDPETKKHPKFIESQARREMFKANLTELEYLEQVGKLIPAEEVDREWFELARLVRDTMLNIPARIADQLAHETDQRKVQDLLEQEIYQALESISANEDQAA